MLGNLPFFMEAEELTNYDIVSYGFDDLEGLYLRGQWTVHRNDPPGINQVSRHCSHLTTLLTCHTTRVLATLLRSYLPHYLLCQVWRQCSHLAWDLQKELAYKVVS